MLRNVFFFGKIQMEVSVNFGCFCVSLADVSVCLRFWAVSPCQTRVSRGTVRRPGQLEGIATR